MLMMIKKISMEKFFLQNYERNINIDLDEVN